MQCWCGPASSDYTKHGESDQCKMACAGDDKFICGGNDAMNMYTLRTGEKGRQVSSECALGKLKAWD